MQKKNFYFILLVGLIGLLTISLLQKDEISIIQSDGKGYYAYLPALILHQEKDFSQTNIAERTYFGENYQPSYLNVTKNGKVYNKYFPGVSILQSPFFIGATIVSAISKSPIDGYSNIYQLFFFFGGLFYAILGLLFFRKSLLLYFPDQQKTIDFITITVFFATPIIVYSLEMVSYSHIYSFCFFGLFSYLILSREKIRFLYPKLGITLGIIFLLRPTNLLIVLILPFLLKDFQTLRLFFQKSFSNPLKRFWLAFVLFMSVCSIQFFLWKWQTGEWVVTAYQGEAFNFLHPHFFDTLFSFRIGLFVHTPILLLSMIGIFYLFKENRFSALAWLFYFLINTWVISSWWCWDYESYFGNRPFTEHLFFLLFPIIPFLQKHKRIGFSLIIFFSLLGFSRFYQFREECVTLQRFTVDTYFNSLFYYKTNNRFQFTRSCPPNGKEKIKNEIYNQSDILTIAPQTTFSNSAQLELNEENRASFYYISIELDKKVKNTPFSDVFLVIDAKDYDSEKRFYHTFELYNDQLEGKDEWKHLIFEQKLDDFKKDYDEINIYIWNKGKKEFRLKNVKYTLFSFD